MQLHGLRVHEMFKFIAYIFLKKSSLTQNAHFLRQKRFGKHYVTLFKMGSIQFWSTIFKLVVPFGKSFIVLKFFLTNFQNFFENDFSDNFLTTFLVIFLITFLSMFLMISNYFYDTFSYNFYKKEPSEIFWTHQLSICYVDTSGPDESN